jgi:hypothetical protein
VKRWPNDVRRTLTCQLNDVLAQISFNCIDARMGQMFVDADLFGHHRFALDH